MEKEQSFGVIPLLKKLGEWNVFLIQHKKGRYWGFPKGHAEPGETAQQTACRELKEETHLDVVRFFDEEPFIERYEFLKKGVWIEKTVFYFVAEVRGTVRLQKEEIQAGVWVPFPEALVRITHQEGKSILSQVAEKWLKS